MTKKQTPAEELRGKIEDDVPADEILNEYTDGRTWRGISPDMLADLIGEIAEDPEETVDTIIGAYPQLKRGRAAYEQRQPEATASLKPGGDDSVFRPEARHTTAAPEALAVVTR